MTLGDRSGEELPSQPEASIAHSISPIRRYRIQAASLPRQAMSSTLQEIHHFKSSVPRTDLQHYTNTFLKRHSLDLLDVGILHSPCSESETEDEDFPFPGKTDEGSTATSQTCEVGREDQAYQPRHMVRWEAILPKITDGGSEMVELGHLVSEPDKPHDNECSASHCGSDALEEENNNFQPSSIIKARLVRSGDHISEVSCSRARHQFPYKKRKFDVTSFACFAESNEPESSREESKFSPSLDHDHEIPQDHQQRSCPSAFDPLFHLFCFYSPERIYELQCQNPGTYDHISTIQFEY